MEARVKHGSYVAGTTPEEAGRVGPSSSGDDFLVGAPAITDDVNPADGPMIPNGVDPVIPDANTPRIPNLDSPVIPDADVPIFSNDTELRGAGGILVLCWGVWSPCLLPPRHIIVMYRCRRNPHTWWGFAPDASLACVLSKASSMLGLGLVPAAL